MSYIHAGMIVVLARGDYFVDRWGNVFAGRSWVGRISPGEDIRSFLKARVREYFIRSGRRSLVVRTPEYDIDIDGQGRIFFSYPGGKVECAFGC